MQRVSSITMTAPEPAEPALAMESWSIVHSIMMSAGSTGMPTNRRDHRLELAALRTPPAISAGCWNGVPADFVVAGRSTSPEPRKILVPPLLGLPGSGRPPRRRCE